MNILGVDYGKKRIGLAWADDAMGTVLPYGVVESLGELTELIKEERIGKVVVGLPIGLSGEEGENVEKVKEFGKELEGETGVGVEFVDERFTSKQADQMGGEASRDEKAAMLILQSYIEKKK